MYFCKILFHGTSKTDPEKIYNQNVGFDLRYANSGIWGNAIYFAKKASYSDKYAFNTNQNGCK